jgi:lipoyl(octanoyl) transferase
MREGAKSAEPVRPLRVRFLGRCDYEEALLLQESLVAAKIGGDEVDDLLLLEHPPVYTLGRGADEGDLLGAPRRMRVPVHRVGRGGGATFHGPGQLVAYPIVRLRPSGRDVHRYIRALEQALIATCARFGASAGVRPGITGVWVEDEKIASIGIGVRRGIAYHGVALNVTTELSYFEQIVPCRAADTKVTSLQKETGIAVAVQRVAGVFAECFASTMGLRLAPASGSSRVSAWGGRGMEPPGADSPVGGGDEII